MNKYNKKLIMDYISGNDIEEYDIEELENDKSFMMNVFDFSNDKNIYNLCSDNLKKDYEFVKYIVLKFKDDINFITTVANYFLENTNLDLESMELGIIMNNLTANNKDENFKYKILNEVAYSGKRMEIELAKLDLNDDNISNEIGMGFSLIYDSYNSSQIILDYYATKMIEDIIEENNIDLESLLHSKFKSADQINEQGLNNYMINFIGLYDQMLSSYLCTHLNLLSDFKNQIIKIQNNWDKYIARKEKEKYAYMFEKVQEYFEENIFSVFSEAGLIYYIGNELGVLDKIKQYDCIDDELCDSIIENSLDGFLEEMIRENFTDRVHYINVKNIMTNILFDDEGGSNSNLDKTGEKTAKCKILKIDIKDKKV